MKSEEKLRSDSAAAAWAKKMSTYWCMEKKDKIIKNRDGAVTMVTTHLFLSLFDHQVYKTQTNHILKSNSVNQYAKTISRILAFFEL